MSVGDPVVLPTIRNLSNTPERDTSPPDIMHKDVDDFPVKDAIQVFDVRFVKIKFPEIISAAAGAVFTIKPTVELATDVEDVILAPVDIYPVTV